MAARRAGFCPLLDERRPHPQPDSAAATECRARPRLARMSAPPLWELHAKVPVGPFTGHSLVRLGLTRAELRRLLTAGLVRRVLVNAYVRSDAPDTIELRAQCLALVCGPHTVVVDRTAAWLWGIDVRDAWDDPGPPVLDVF